jgi:hypothetical protein
MRSVVRLYLAWRLVRVLRPVVGLAVLAAVVLSLHLEHAGHGAPLRPGASALTRGALAAEHDLGSSLRRAFMVGPSTR